jgi:hypothetical protein
MKMALVLLAAAFLPACSNNDPMGSPEASPESAADADGDRGGSPDTRTPADSGDLARSDTTLRVGIAADVHIRDGNRAQLKEWSHVKEWMKRFLDSMEAWEADFNIELGDFIDGHEPDPASGDGHEDRIQKGKAVWETSMAPSRTHKVPYYYVMGNHEVQNGWSNAKMAKTKGMPANHYSFDKKGYHFIVLDTNYSGLTNPKSFRIPAQQVSWLRGDVTAMFKLWDAGERRLHLPRRERGHQAWPASSWSWSAMNSPRGSSRSSSQSARTARGSSSPGALARP